MKLDEFGQISELYGQTMDYWESRGIVKVRSIMPYYLSSLGCHVLNLHNYTVRPIFARSGAITDLRLHQFLVGPPGYGKSFTCNILFNPRYGVAWDEAGYGFLNREVGYLNLASLIGTVVGLDEDGDPVTRPGIAETYSEHVIWAEEFAGIREVMKTDYSAGFGDAFLKLTDDGKVERDMRFGSISYQSFVTMWLGTQTERLDLPSGLSRRFQFIDLNVSLSEIAEFNEAWHNSRNVFPDVAVLDHLRGGFSRLCKTFVERTSRLERIEFRKDYRDYILSLNTPHVNKESLERLAIGYNFMTGYEYRDTVLEVRYTPELGKLMENALDMRYRILGHLEFAVIEALMRGGDWMTHTDVCKLMVGLGTNYKDASKRLHDMSVNGLLETRVERASGRGRPTTLYRLDTEYESAW